MGTSNTRAARRLFSGAALASALCGALIAQERTRESIPDKYKWNLSDLYASDDLYTTPHSSPS